MLDPGILWAGTDQGGGITTYVQVMQQTPLWSEWNIRYVVTHRDGSASAKIWTFARGGLLFVFELIRSRPRVVHLHSASDTSFVRKGILLWASWFALVPVVIHIHGANFNEYYHGSHRLLQRAIRATLSRASAVVALGEDRAATLREIAPKARIVVIPNAVRPAHRVAQPDVGQPVHVVFLGRIGERKGTFRLLDAWAELTSSPDFRANAGTAAILTIAGDGEVERARHRVGELRLQDSVQVHGWLSESEVGDLLDTAHVLALPSLNEGQPMAVLEAMARGLCVVASGVGGLPEMIGGGCGVIISPDDIGAIAAALRHVIHDRELRTRYGGAGYARAVEQFDVGTVWRRLDALYREVAGQKTERVESV